MWRRIAKQLAYIACISGMAANAYAIAPGFYMGLMGGPATNAGNQQPIQVNPLPTAQFPQANTVQGNPKSMQFGFRAYLGYKFNQYAGFEFGLDHFSTIKYTLGKTIYSNPDNPITQPPTAAAGVDYRVRGIDIVGKLDYAFRGINVFGKAGIAALYTTTPGGLNVENYHVVTTTKKSTGKTSVTIVNSGSNTYASKVVPALALGAGYDFNQNWVMDVSAMTFLVGGNIKSVTMYALGLSYHFVDKYCGQFLCDD